MEEIVKAARLRLLGPVVEEVVLALAEWLMELRVLKIKKSEVLVVVRTPT